MFARHSNERPCNRSLEFKSRILVRFILLAGRRPFQTFNSFPRSIELSIGALSRPQAAYFFYTGGCYYGTD